MKHNYSGSWTMNLGLNSDCSVKSGSSSGGNSGSSSGDSSGDTGSTPYTESESKTKINALKLKTFGISSLTAAFLILDLY